MITTEPFHDAPDDHGESAGRTERPKWRDDRRLDKHMDRMSTAMQYRDVENEVIAEVDGTPHMSLLTRVQDAPHWAQVRRAIRRAREDGYAYFSVDYFIGYSVHYSPTGIRTADLEMGNLVDDVQNSILATELGDRNSITVNHLPVKEDFSQAPFMLPFYLYDIPQRAIREIIESKLVITAYLNAGHVERALTEAGLDVEPQNADRKDSCSFKVSATLTWPDGSTKIEIPAPWQEIWTVMHEFRGMESVLSKIEAIRDIPNRIPFAAFRDSWKKTYDELSRASNPLEDSENSEEVA